MEQKKSRVEQVNELFLGKNANRSEAVLVARMAAFGFGLVGCVWILCGLLDLNAYFVGIALLVGLPWVIWHDWAEWKDNQDGRE